MKAKPISQLGWVKEVYGPLNCRTGAAPHGDPAIRFDNSKVEKGPPSLS